MDWMITVAQLLLSISILVAVHEMGHLLAAKYFGMRVEQFSIGFPPKIFSFKKGETEYALSAIPLGGYVKISGMIDESLDTDAMNKEPQPWEFRSKPAWQRLIVMLGGIIVNVIVGVMIFIGITAVYGDDVLVKDELNNNGGFLIGPVGQGIGLKTGDKIIRVNGKDYDYVNDLTRSEVLLADQASYTVEREGKVIEIPIPPDFIKKFNKKNGIADFLGFRMLPVVDSIKPGSIAEKIKLQIGDRFTSVNDTAVSYYDEVAKLVRGSKRDSLSFTVMRGSEELAFKVPFKAEAAIGFYVDLDGFLAKARKHIDYDFGESIPLGTQRAFTTLVSQVKAFGKVITGTLPARESISGPIGIAQAFGTEWDWQRFWTLTGVLSLVLAFMNLLPIPALDGGHVMFLSYEMISRRKPSDKFLETAQKIGMVFLLTLMVFIFANDIIKQWFD
jgi:regulator of sigma E protease